MSWLKHQEPPSEYDTQTTKDINLMADILTPGHPVCVTITDDGSHTRKIPKGGGIYRIIRRDPDQPQRDPKDKRRDL